MSKNEKQDSDFRFAVAINSDLEKAKIVSVIKKLFPSFINISPVALREHINMLVLSESDLFDPDKINGDEGWIYYKYELSVFPMKETTLKCQRALAAELIKKFKNIGFQAELICEDAFLE